MHMLVRTGKHYLVQRRAVLINTCFAVGTHMIIPGSISALSRHRRRHVRCADMGVLVLKMTASERRSF